MRELWRRVECGADVVGHTVPPGPSATEGTRRGTTEAGRTINNYSTSTDPRFFVISTTKIDSDGEIENKINPITFDLYLKICHSWNE